MTIKEYKCKAFTLKLCDFDDRDREIYFRLSVECGGKWKTDYIFDTHNFGIEMLDKKRFLKAIEKHNINLNVKELTEAICDFYPFSQYIRIIGL